MISCMLRHAPLLLGFPRGYRNLRHRLAQKLTGIYAYVYSATYCNRIIFDT